MAGRRTLSALVVLTCLPIAALAGTGPASGAGPRVDRDAQVGLDDGSSDVRQPSSDWRSYVLAPPSRDVAATSVLAASIGVRHPSALLARGGGTARLERRVQAGNERWPSGTTAEASSSAAGHPATAAVDADPDTWWRDATPDEGPDVLTITAARPVALPGITVVGSSRGWPRDFAVDTWIGGRWVRSASVDDSDTLTAAAVFRRPVITDRVRVTVTQAWVDRSFPLRQNEHPKVVDVVPGVVSDAYVDLDFAQVVTGRIEVVVDRASDPAPSVRVATSELRRDLSPRSDYSHSDYGPDVKDGGGDEGVGSDQFVPAPGGTAWTDEKGCQFGEEATGSVCADGLRGFRYARVYLGTAEGDGRHAATYGSVDIDAVRLRFTPYLGTPDRFEGHFLSSDETLNRVWYSSVYTAELVTDTFAADNVDPRGCAVPDLEGRPIFHDGAKRDRCPYAGGMDQVMLATYVAHPNPDPVRTQLHVFSTHQNPQNGWIPGSPIFNYSTQYQDAVGRWATELFRYVLWSGDLDFARDHWSTLVGVLDTWYPQVTNSRGLMLDNLALSTEEVLALRNGADLAEALGGEYATKAPGWRELADRVERGINEHLWDEPVGAYHGSWGGGCHPQWNGRTVTDGVAKGERADRALDYLATLATPWGNPYNDNAEACPLFGIDTTKLVYGEGSAQEADARLVLHRDREALEQVRRTYGWQLDHDPASTLWEGYGAPDGDPSALFGRYFTSAAHGHMAGAAAVLSTRVLGVEPTGFGFARYDAIPHPGDLLWAKGAVPTPHGSITTRWSRDSDGNSFRMSLDAPAGTVGRVGVPTFGNRVEVRLNGRVVWDGDEGVGRAAHTDGRYVYLEDLPGGSYELVSHRAGAPRAPLAGVRLLLEPQPEVTYAGETRRVSLTFRNDTAVPVFDVEAALKGSAATPVRAKANLVRPYDDFVATFDVAVPRDQPATDALALSGTATYRVGEEVATVEATGALRVASPVRITSVSASPPGTTPGMETVARTVVTNRSSVSVQGALAAELPNGWGANPASAPYDLSPGEEATFETRLQVPSSEVRPIAEVPLVASYAGTEGDRRAVTIYLTPPPTGTVYLSDLEWGRASSGWGTVRRDRAVSGNPLSLGGQTYNKGLGTHAASVISYYLGAHCTRLQADVGVDDAVGDNGSVVFQVEGDGQKLYDSGRLTGASPRVRVDIDVSGVQVVDLIVNDAGDANAYDHADWADAQVTCES